MEVVNPAEMEALRRDLEEKKEEIGRLSSPLAVKVAEQQVLQERWSQRGEELEDMLDQLTAGISELAARLLVAEEDRMRAEVALEDLKSREDVVDVINTLVSRENGALAINMLML